MCVYVCVLQCMYIINIVICVCVCVITTLIVKIIAVKFNMYIKIFLHYMVRVGLYLHSVAMTSFRRFAFICGLQ